MLVLPEPIDPGYKIEGSFLSLKLYQIGNHFSTKEDAIEFDTYTKKDVLLYMIALEENGVPLSSIVRKYIETYKNLSKDETTDAKVLLKLYNAAYKACKSVAEKLPEFAEKSLVKPVLVGYISYKRFANIMVKRNIEILKDVTDLSLLHNPKGRQFYLKLPNGNTENIEFEITFYPKYESLENEETV